MLQKQQWAYMNVGGDWSSFANVARYTNTEKVLALSPGAIIWHTLMVVMIITISNLPLLWCFFLSYSSNQSNFFMAAASVAKIKKIKKKRLGSEKVCNNATSSM